MKAFLSALPLVATLAGAASADDTPAAMQREARAIVAACRADYLRYCSAVRPGGGRVLACLAAQPPQALSPDCRGLMPRAQALATQAAALGALPK